LTPRINTLETRFYEKNKERLKRLIKNVVAKLKKYSNQKKKLSSRILSVSYSVHYNV